MGSCKCARRTYRSKRRVSMKGGKSIFKRLGIARTMKHLGRRKDVKVLGRKIIKKIGNKIDRL